MNADHRGLLLGMADPQRLRVNRPRTKLYPPPLFARDAAEQVAADCIAKAQSRMRRGVQGWDECKVQLQRSLRACYNAQRTKMTRSYRQRLRRIEKALRQLEQPKGVAATAARQDDMAALRQAAAALHAEWHAATRHGRQAQRMADEWYSTRAAFKRVSTKRAAQSITHIQPTPGHPTRDHRHVADALADGCHPDVWLASGHVGKRSPGQCGGLRA